MSLKVLTSPVGLSFCLASIAASALSGCGESSRQTGDSPARAIDGVVLIEDGEDGDATLLADEEAGFIGYWYTYDDRQECVHPDFATGTTVACGEEACAAAGDETKTAPPTRPYDGEFVMGEYAAVGTDAPPLEGKQKKNEHGIRLTGGGNMYFGAGIGVGLNNPATLGPKDISQYYGVRFIAKSGDGQPLRLRVKIKDAYSEPEGGNCVYRKNVCSAETCQCCNADETMCEPGSAMTLVQGCHDDPMAPEALTRVEGTDWKLFELDFSEFVREGWGEHHDGKGPPTTALEPTVAYQLQFQVQTSATPATMPLAPFDLWIDNIGFLTEPVAAPQGTALPE